MQPTTKPSSQPTSRPSLQPTVTPSVAPSNQPINDPTAFPTEQPSSFPSAQPSTNPSLHPFTHPTSSPTLQPNSAPTTIPSFQPLAFPTSFPSSQPTTIPSNQPYSYPSSSPTQQPTAIPTVQPFSFPTSTPGVRIYQTKGVLFFPGNAIYTAEPVNKNDTILGSCYILFGKNFRHHGGFPFSISLGSTENQNLVAVVRDNNAGISSDTVSRSTTVIGDINNDGFLDLMIGMPLESRSFVYFGTSFGVENKESFKIIGDPEQGGAQLGWASARVGDLNHDGFDEIMVSAPFSNIVYFIHGKAEFNEDILVDHLIAKDGSKVFGSQEDANFGVSLALLHDFNKDGFQDIAITAVRPGGQNVVYILLGNPVFGKEDIHIDQLITNSPASCFRIFAPYLSYAGYSVAGIGDINNDDYNDIAIGSIPINNAKYAIQKTYIIYGRDMQTKNILRLSEMTEKDGFIITGGGFLVQAAGDVNGDGIADLMIISYYDWKNKGNAYLINYPQNVTYSPTFQPSSSPSMIPSSVPSASPSTAFPTSTASLLQTTSFPSSFNLSADQNPVDIIPRSPTIKPTCKPTRMPSFRPSYSHSSIPSNAPITLTPTRKPTNDPTAIRQLSPVLPSRVPFTFPPTKPHLRSENPTTLPTESITPTGNIEYTEVDCNKAGYYEGRNSTNYSFTITAQSGTVKITGIEAEAGVNIYILTCPVDQVDVAITNFRLSTDIISVTHLAGYSYSSMNEISYSLKKGPLTLLFCYENKLQVILSSHTSFALSDKNFLVTHIKSNNAKNMSTNSKVFARFQIGVVVTVIVLLILIFWALSYQNKLEEKEEQKHEESLSMCRSAHNHDVSSINSDRQDSLVPCGDYNGQQIEEQPKNLISLSGISNFLLQEILEYSEPSPSCSSSSSSSSTSSTEGSQISFEMLVIEDEKQEEEDRGSGNVDDISSINTNEWHDVLSTSDDDKEE
jgi:hypothetical protein